MTRLALIFTTLCLSYPTGGAAIDDDLIGHWRLSGDAKDHSGNGRDAVNRGVDLSVDGGAIFDGREAFLEVPAGRELAPGRGDFSVAAWIDADDSRLDLPGDIVSQYDSAARRGFQLAIKTNVGVTLSQANDRRLEFGIDDGRQSEWIDCGRPGESSILAFALVVHDGELYAGTCEPGRDQSGRVYRYTGGSEWVDCGSPAACNAVTAMCVFEGRLYAGVGKYRLGGSALVESENPNLGGGVYRYEGGDRWTECGGLPGAEAVSGLVVYGGKLYAGSLYRPAQFYRYEGGTSWTDCGTPGDKRVEALGVYNGHLYATGYDEGHVYRYDGTEWTDCGALGENTQTYGFAVYEGRLFVGTWPTGRVYRFEDVGRWQDVGRLGEELEVMGMLVHNGRLLAGSLPLAEVYEYQGGDAWRRLVQLDATPDVKYRRAWTMAEYGGKLFVSTLPSGRVYSFESGKSVAWDRPFPAGRHHVAAVKSGGVLRLYVDGKAVAESEDFDPADYDLTTARPLLIGAGSNDRFFGRMSEVRLYKRALTDREVSNLTH